MIHLSLYILLLDSLLPHLLEHRLMLGGHGHHSGTKISDELSWLERRCVHALRSQLHFDKFADDRSIHGSAYVCLVENVVCGFGCIGLVGVEMIFQDFCPSYPLARRGKPATDSFLRGLGL